MATVAQLNAVVTADISDFERTLTAAERRAKKTGQALERDLGEGAAQAERKVKRAAGSSRDLGEEAERAGGKVKRAGDRVKETGDKAEQAAKKTEVAADRLRRLGGSAEDAGRRLSLGFTLPFVAAVGFGVKKAADYEQSMNVFQAVTEAGGDEMARAATLAKDLGADLTLPNVSAADAAISMTELAKAGLSVNDVLGASKGVLQMAAAGELENADAARIAANALNAFHLRGSEAVRIADLFAAASNASSAEVSDLAEAMQMSSAVYASAGQNVEDLITALTMMANAGQKGSDAGTSLKAMMINLQTPTKQQRDLMEKYGISIYDAAGKMIPLRDMVEQFSRKLGPLTQQERDFALGIMLGSDAIRAGQIVLMGGVRAYDKMKEAVTRVGAAHELAEARTRGFWGALGGFMSNVETASVNTFEPLLKRMGDVVLKGSEMVSWLDQTSPAVKELVLSGLALVAVLGPIEIAFGALANGIASQIKLWTLLAGVVKGSSLAFAAVPAAVGVAVVALGVLATKHYEAKAAAEAQATAQHNLRIRNEQLAKSFQTLDSILGKDKAGGWAAQLERIKKAAAEAGDDVNALSRLHGQLLRLEERVVTAKGLTPAQRAQARKAIDQAFVQVKDAIDDGLYEMEQQQQGFWSKFTEVYTKRAQNWGVSVAGGMARGMYGGQGEIVAAAIANAKAAETATQRALQMRSPSRVMMRQGQDIAQGLALGIAGGAPAVQAAMRTLAQAVKQEAISDAARAYADQIRSLLREAAAPQGRAGELDWEMAFGDAHKWAPEWKAAARGLAEYVDQADRLTALREGLQDTWAELRRLRLEAYGGTGLQAAVTTGNLRGLKPESGFGQTVGNLAGRAAEYGPGSQSGQLWLALSTVNGELAKQARLAAAGDAATQRLIATWAQAAAEADQLSRVLESQAEALNETKRAAGGLLPGKGFGGLGDVFSGMQAGWEEMFGADAKGFQAWQQGTADALTKAHESYLQTEADLRRQIALFGEAGDAVAAFNWDLANTDKYKFWSPEEIANVRELMGELQRLDGIRTVTGEISDLFREMATHGDPVAEAIYRVAHDPELAALPRELQDAYVQAVRLHAEWAVAQNKMREWADGFKGVFEDAFSSLLEGSGNFLRSLGDGFRNLLNRMASDFLSSELMKMLMGSGWQTGQWGGWIGGAMAKATGANIPNIPGGTEGAALTAAAGYLQGAGGVLQAAGAALQGAGGQIMTGATSSATALGNAAGSLTGAAFDLRAAAQVLSTAWAGGGAGNPLDLLGLAAASGGGGGTTGFLQPGNAGAGGGGLFTAATGGSFIVPGTGPTDSRFVRMALTPGERVTVETPAQQRRRERATISVTMHVHTPDAQSFRLGEAEIVRRLAQKVAAVQANS